MKRPGHNGSFFLVVPWGIKKPPTATGGGCWPAALRRSYVPTPPTEGVIRMRTTTMLVCEHGEYADSEMAVKYSIVNHHSISSSSECSANPIQPRQSAKRHKSHRPLA